MSKIKRDYGYFVMPDAIVDSDLSGEAKAVYMVLARHADKAGECFPSGERIGKLAGYSRRKIVSAVKELEDRGWLSHQRTGRSNLYTLRTVCASDEQELPIRSAPAAQEGQPIEVQPKKEESPSKGYTQVFEEIWSGYPRKLNKQGAWKAFRTRCREGESASLMAACAAEYAKRVRGTEEKFIMHGSTFFGPNKRYLDYKPKAPAPANKIPSHRRRSEPSLTSLKAEDLFTPQEIQRNRKAIAAMKEKLSDRRKMA